jgi:hypothetical protein
MTFYPQELTSFNDGVNSILAFGNDFFPVGIFNEEFEKHKWLSKAQSYYISYKKEFFSVEFSYDEKNAKIKYFLNNGEVYVFDQREKDEIKPMPFIYIYPSNDFHESHSGLWFFNNEKYEFLFSVYGKNNKDIGQNLEVMYVFGHGILFNKKNNAATSLKRSIEGINEIAVNDEEVKKWIGGIKTYTHITTGT